MKTLEKLTFTTDIDTIGNLVLEAEAWFRDHGTGRSSRVAMGKTRSADISAGTKKNKELIAWIRQVVYQIETRLERENAREER